MNKNKTHIYIEHTLYPENNTNKQEINFPNIPIENIFLEEYFFIKKDENLVNYLFLGVLELKITQLFFGGVLICYFS